MDSGNGNFIPLTEEQANIASRLDEADMVFSVGEVVKIKNSYFVVKKILDRRMNLKLLPTARGKELYEAAHPGLRKATP